MTTAAAGPTGIRSRVFLAGLALVGLGVGTVVAVAHHDKPADVPVSQRAYTMTELRALANLKVPTTFQRVPSTWSCEGNEQSLCYTSSLSGPDAVQAMVASLGAKAYTTTLGSGAWLPRYSMCISAGAVPAVVAIAARPDNAVLESGTWIVPPGQRPHFHGTVVNISLTGPGNCGS